MPQKPYIDQLVMSAAARQLDKFRSILCKYEERGILNSEMLAICSLCEKLGVSAIVESGRARGYSTGILAKYFKDRPLRIISIDWEKAKWFIGADDKFAKESLAPYKNVELLYGNSVKLMPALVKKLKNERVAILMDGPKGKEAVDLAKKILDKYKNVVVAFVHDMDKRTPHRAQMEETFNNIFFTDSGEYLKLHSELDADCFKHDEAEAAKSLAGQIEREIYEPTLAIVFPDDHKFEAQKNRIFP